jgi:hypothetical protein
MPLILRRASISRSSGQWSEDDYNVYAGQRNVSRIFKVDAGHPAENAMDMDHPVPPAPTTLVRRWTPQNAGGR